MKKTIKTTALATALIGCAIQPALSHRAWLLPSTTVLSGENTWVTFDAAVSNNLFFANHRGVDPESVQVIGPDGKAASIQNASQGHFRSTFDLELSQEGTYQIFSGRDGLSAMWKEGDERKRWRGTAEELAKEGLAKKEGVRLSENVSRVVTFVTSGKPNKEALKPTGKGLEIVFTHNHPNDLFAGEEATFTLHLNGKPAAATEVTLVKGNDRFRNDAGEVKVTTNEKGEFSITWKEAGRYWINASVSADGGEIDGVPLSKRSSYTATLEVLPE
ncbi:DUF4198 domain-containing protein [Verrucomicrobiaceae bacterium R5-34]|uniref:DUF4198 domain-containing protein n=1 Tax=Oceaniferula flava TaxID=2800421 RepID=A0AAE2SEM2_9BACT|nr:DUF4198 domain-containing protein [Oceaniferula flavus]MBK1832261.1 DUF4198 domain-containing protein [Verrucomicrobiaceae bacterium R5-34]MBK1854901.1 DUF4198 domain-containing protein [Oceaniferula flavus]MBM1136207.1 DUF4198 domain-containing protein [Oceaniferula flavus]